MGGQIAQQQATRAGAISSNRPQRLLGAIGMIGSPVFLIMTLLAKIRHQPVDDHTLLGAVLGWIYLAGFLASVIAMRHLRLTGRGIFAATLFAVQVAALLLAATQQALDLSSHINHSSGFYTACDFAWPISHVLMLVAGGAVLAARVWRGPSRFLPLCCGLALPLAMIGGAFFGKPVLDTLFAIFTTASFFSLGYSLFAFHDTSPSW